MKNAGSILSNIYFIGYLISFLILCHTKADYLKNEIGKLLSDDNDDSSEINNDDQVKENISEDNKEEVHVENTEKDNKENKEVEEIKINKKKKESNNKIKNTKTKFEIGHKDYKDYLNSILNGDKIDKIGVFKKHRISKAKNKKTHKEKLSENKNLGSKEASSVNKLAILDEEKLNNINKYQSEKEESESKKSENENEGGALSNYELNELEYEEALELDNRNFLE